MKQEDIIRMAREVNNGKVRVWEDCHLLYPDELERFAELVFEQGRQEGMKQERALWTLTKLGQEIEAQPEERNFCPRCGKRLASGFVEISIHTCTPPKEKKTKEVAAGSQAFYGFPNEPVSTPNAGGKCVTAGETAPTPKIDPNQWAFDRGLEST
jgi:hypothetical protein